MNNSCVAHKAFTLVETLVVGALGVFVFGMILDALVETGRATDRATAQQQMSQEALLIAQHVQKVARYVVIPQELQPPGGAAPRPPAGGGTTTTTLPSPIIVGIVTTASLAATPTTSAPATSTPTPPVTPTPAESHTSSTLPPSVRPLFHPDAVTTHGARSGLERYEREEFRTCSLAAPALGPVCSFTNQNDSKGQCHVALLHSFLDAAQTTRSAPRLLGVHQDRFQSQIAFRYASDFERGAARWSPRSAERPCLAEYSVRVWPGTGSRLSFEAARQAHEPCYELTGAVRLP